MYIMYIICSFDIFRALYGSFLGLMIILILLTTLGLVIFTTYAECDLLMSKSLSSPDQVQFPTRKYV